MGKSKKGKEIVKLYPSISTILEDSQISVLDLARLLSISKEAMINRLNFRYIDVSEVGLRKYLKSFTKVKSMNIKEVNANLVRDLALRKITYGDELSMYKTNHISKIVNLESYIIPITYKKRTISLKTPKIVDGFKVYNEISPEYRIYLLIFGNSWKNSNNVIVKEYITEYCNVEHKSTYELGNVLINVERIDSKANKLSVLEIEPIKGITINGDEIIKEKYEKIMPFLREKGNFVDPKTKEAISINNIGFKGLSPRYRKLWEELKDLSIKEISKTFRDYTPSWINEKRNSNNPFHDSIYNVESNLPIGSTSKTIVKHTKTYNLGHNKVITKTLRGKLWNKPNFDYPMEFTKLKEVSFEYPQITKDERAELRVKFDKFGNCEDMAYLSEKPLDLNPSPFMRLRLDIHKAYNEKYGIKEDLPYPTKTYTLEEQTFILRSQIRREKGNNELRSLHLDRITACYFVDKYYYANSNRQFTNYYPQVKGKRILSNASWIEEKIVNSYELLLSERNITHLSPLIKSKPKGLYEQARDGDKTYYCLVSWRSIVYVNKNYVKGKSEKFVQILGKTGKEQPLRNRDLFAHGYKAVKTKIEVAFPTKTFISHISEKDLFDLWEDEKNSFPFPFNTKFGSQYNHYSYYWVRTNVPFTEFENYGDILLPNAKFGKDRLSYTPLTISDLEESVQDQPCREFNIVEPIEDLVWDKEYQQIFDLKNEIRESYEELSDNQVRERILEELETKKNSVQDFKNYIPDQHVLELSPKFQKDDLLRAFNMYYSSLNTAKGLIFNDTGSNLTGKSRIRIEGSLKRDEYKDLHAIVAYLSNLPKLAKINYDGKVFRPNATHNYRQIIHYGLYNFFSLFDQDTLSEYYDLEEKRLNEGIEVNIPLFHDYFEVIDMISNRGLDSKDNLFDVLDILNRNECLIKSYGFRTMITDKLEEITKISDELGSSLIIETFTKEDIEEWYYSDENMEYCLNANWDTYSFNRYRDNYSIYMKLLENWESYVGHLSIPKTVIGGMGTNKPLYLVAYCYWNDLPLGHFSNEVETFKEFLSLAYNNEKEDLNRIILDGTKYRLNIPEIEEIPEYHPKVGDRAWILMGSEAIGKIITKVNKRSVEFNDETKTKMSHLFESEEQIDFCIGISDENYLNDLSVLLIEVKNYYRPYFMRNGDKKQLEKFESVQISYNKKSAKGYYARYHSRRNVITVNRILSTFHPLVIKFEIFHELTHILYMNHGNEFRFMESLFPNYNMALRLRTTKEWLIEE